MKRTYYYALVDPWHGMLCSIPKGHENRSPSFVQRWARVDKKEYHELRREGFWVKTNKIKTNVPRRRHGPLRDRKR